MKSKFVRYLIVVVCVIAILIALVKVLTPSKKMNTYLALGDYLSVSGKLKGKEITSFTSLLGDYFIENELIESVNTSYTSSSVDSSLLLEMISKDAYSGEDSGIVSLIKDSKYITVSVGMNDIINYIRLDSENKKVIYDKEYLIRKLGIMKQNYYEIVEQIKELNEGVSVYLVSYYCPFEWINELNEEDRVFDLLNESIKEVSEATGAYYVDISELGTRDYMFNDHNVYLNNQGQKNVFAIIKDRYFE